MISIIVAVAEDNAIGLDNGLLWHISEDLKYFKRITTGHPVIMGRKTFESIGRPLPGRKNIVVSRSGAGVPAGHEDAVVSAAVSTAVPAKILANTSLSVERDLGELLSRIGKASEEYFVIGGGSIYREAFGYADRLYITRIHAVKEGADTFFPEISPEEWCITERSGPKRDDENGIDFEFIVYDRKDRVRKGAD